MIYKVFLNGNEIAERMSLKPVYELIRELNERGNKGKIRVIRDKDNVEMYACNLIPDSEELSKMRIKSLEDTINGIKYKLDGVIAYKISQGLPLNEPNHVRMACIRIADRHGCVIYGLTKDSDHVELTTKF